MNRKFPSAAAAARVLCLVGCIVLLAYLAACGGGGSESPAGQSQYGRINLRITDSPVTSAERVVVQFTGLEIKPVGAAQPEVFDFAPRRIDLLALDGGGSEILLADEMLPAGEYESIRLKVNAGRNGSDSFIELDDGSMHPLFIPSGNQTGLKLIRGFTIGAGSTHNFTIDFDLRKSVIHPPGLGDPYLLKPVLRLVNNLEVGTIDGTVASAPHRRWLRAGRLSIHRREHRARRPRQRHAAAREHRRESRQHDGQYRFRWDSCPPARTLWPSPARQTMTPRKSTTRSHSRRRSM